jgi:serine/threonine-protein kinase
VLWHHAVHRSRAETLYFWRLGFYPTYDAGAAATLLHRVLHQAGIRAAVCYEMYGPHDLMLRVWLPSSSEFSDFQDTLIATLAPANVNMCDPFQVTSPLRHWLFAHNGTGLLRPTDDNLKLLDDTALVAAAESGTLDPAKIDELKHHHLVGVFDGHTETVNPDTPGTKFAVVISGSPRLTTDQHQQFQRTIIEQLDRADQIEQRSLYSGAGFGHFVVMGMVKDQPLCALNESLLAPISRQNIGALYGARSYTHVSGRRDYVFIYESLRDSVPPFPPDVESVRDSAIGRAVEPSARAGGDPVEGELFASRFQIVRTLGHGGFSRVYLVIDRIENADRALKVFSSTRADEQLRREIAFLRKVNHRNVMKVFWADRTPDGRWYLVSEYVEGTPLDRLMTSPRKFTPDEAGGILDELLEALIAIHPDETRIAELHAGELTPEEFAELQELQAAGFVHRDIKPGNIILGADGLKLLDFNIASSAGDPVDTHSGTPPYQAPDAMAVWDVSTDLFAAGVVFYELLTGRHPYPDERPRVDREPIDPQQAAPDLPPKLAAFVVKACAGTASDRFSSAKEMKVALELALRDEPATRAQEFGVRVTIFREDATLTIRELAERAGLEEWELAEIEAGEKIASIAQAQDLARALRIAVSRLLGTTEG